jgi:hypothetical protein
MFASGFLTGGRADFLTQALPAGVDFSMSDDGGRLRLSAIHDLSGIASGWFAAPAVSVALDPASIPHDTEFLGFALTQFALPVTAGASLDFDFNPAPNLHSPRAVLPLLARSAGGCTLLAPLTSPHEQILAIVDGALRWGWHGDLDQVPAGFSTELGVYRGSSPTEVFDAWGADIAATAPRARRSRQANPVTSHLSYWTDNGAAYWYRTEPGLTIGESVIRTVQELRADGVPIVAVELDSWFYPHETNRPIAEIGYPEEVPPTGAWLWEPRPDAFADPDARQATGAAGAVLDPIERFADALGRPPLILHARHIDPTSPYVDAESWWVDLLAAHPFDPAFFRRWFDDAVRWGATCIEQDWMLIYWFGVRALRSSPGRAMAWQRALNDHATASGIDLMWCMATPADLIAASRFDRVIAVRTSDDYRFADDPALLWTWFLTVNRLIAPLGLWPFKDCFFSNPVVGSEPIDGDSHAEIEALLSAMSGGPVGIGDRRGRTDRDIVMRTCDDEGRLVQPDHPIGMIDACLFGAPARGERLAWATTWSSHGADRWTYVIALNTSTDRITITDELDIADIGLHPDHVVYDWRASTWSTGAVIGLELEPRDWALFVCCPIVDGLACVGDTTKYVTMGGDPASRPNTAIAVTGR